MSRFERAVARLRQGDAILLFDETREGTAHLLAAGVSAESTATRLMQTAARGTPILVQAPDASAAFVDDASLPSALAGLAPSRASSRRGGVLARPEPVEAASDLAAAAGVDGPALLRAADLPGGVLAREGEPLRFAQAHGLAALSIQDIVAHRLSTETIVEEVAAAQLPTIHAAEPLEVHAFRSLVDGSEHLALIRRDRDGGFGPEPLVRLHSECLTGDALGSLRCDCGEQLRRALKLIGEDRQGGALLYLRGQEGRGIGLANKISAYALQERGFDTVDANTELGFLPDQRDYGVAVQMLGLLGIKRLRLLANNPAKREALERYGITVTERRHLRIGPNPHNASYLETKRLRMGHDLPAGLRIVSET